MNETASISVLHVDDEPDFAELAAEMLEREDDRFTVATATSASEGLERLAADDFDCIVADYDMPVQTGIEFLERVRDEFPDLPFILYTGKGDEEVASDAISAGVTDYLQKGSGTSQYAVLANRIRNAVENYHAQVELADREQRLTLFFEQSPLGVIEWDENFDLARMNDAAEEILGYGEDELAGRSWEAIVPESDRDAVADVVADLLENKGGYHSINENVRKDGERIICEWHNRVVTDENEDVVAIFSQFQEITERKEREQAIEHLHNSARAFMEAETAEQVANVAVDAVRDTLGLPANGLHLYDESEDGLVPVAWTSRVEEIAGEPPTFVPGEGIAGTAFETGDAQIYDDISTVPDRYNLDTDVRSQIVLPLDDHGVLVIGCTEPEAFDDTDVSLAHMLATHATAALDRIEREQSLQEEREFNQQALDTIDDLFYVVGTSGTLRRWNDHFSEVTGYSDEELADMHATELFPEDERATVADGIEKTLTSGETILEAELLTNDGERIPYEFTGSRLTDTDGDVIGLIGIGRDISDRKQREDALEQLHAATRDLMTTTTVEEVATRASETVTQVLKVPMNGIHLYDPEADALVPVAWADRTDDLLDGSPPALPVGDSLAGQVYRTGEPQSFANVREAEGTFDPETPFRSECILPLGDHGVFILSSPEADVFDATEEALADVFAANVESALDHVEQRQQLQREHDRLDEFASILSHDLRNPLNVATGRLELAQRECDSDYLDDVAQAHDRIDALIDDILTLTREGKQVEDPGPVDLGVTVDGCWQNVETAEATLVIETGQTIHAEAGRLKQLLENLFRNAVEHGGETVRVTVGDLDDGFYVADDGPGIPEDERDEVFEAGYSTADEGTGFGLNIVQEIGDAHGWEVTVTDSERGGARFEITGVETGAP